MMKQLNFSNNTKLKAISKFVVCMTFATSPIPAFCQADSVKVLFIGNSLTAGAPDILRQMISENKKKVKIYTSLLSGVQLKDFYNQFKNTTAENIASETSLALYEDIFTDYKFNYVILQGGAMGFLIPEVREQIFDKIEKFNAPITLSGAEMLLYQNFPSYAYPKQVCIVNDDRSDIFCIRIENSKSQIDTLRESFRTISKRTAAKVVLIGEAFEYCHTYYPELQILDTDKEHQSRLGAYLIACLFYKALTKEDWSSTSFDNEFGTETIQNIKYVLAEYQK